ncbi:[protein-PII] uridylyltransferase [Lignipirellula cremea]|uniref:Bifunctional uridylyltransferase/uridylyl-removing enzyme n=1 Tax=Lignipirellula cremea TaxID=2528010 RepID=A0A518DS21_9BACT|nr:[protein-PII] uridylyltransferase [Lignipirellula cremea]QDU94624.1 Bifunctional uridylyltransferase/uridylyl-removing enzyme [Lignipirellula cremea]
MNHPPGIRPVVIEAKDRLRIGREKLRAQHLSGSPGIQVCTRLTELVDTVLVEFYNSILADMADSDPTLAGEFVLAPNGGYGRRDLAPYSDVDLMLLYRPGSRDRVAPFARLLTQYIYDAGLDLGFSLRTPSEACSLATADAETFTALAESRVLIGNKSLFKHFMERFQRLAKRKSQRLISVIEEARLEERSKYGETVYLLKPNVKRSRGGLRDIQLLRWIGFARYGEVEPENLRRQGALAAEDRMRLRAARDFLLRLRNELHFHAGKSRDVLDKDEQLRIAQRYGYQGGEAVLPVEEFMREYFEHTSAVRSIVAHFVATAKNRWTFSRLLEPLFSHQVERDFYVGFRYIGANRRGLAKVCGDLAQTLRLMDLANWYDKRIDHHTWTAIRDSMSTWDEVELTSEAKVRFLSLVSQPARLGNLLRQLHDLRVLEKIIPAVRHARCLLQFNEYHKYTVDEHSLRAIERCTEFASDPGALGDAYRSIREKRILHLALLLHDLGKGFVEDHSEVGRRIATETAVRLGLAERDAGTLQFLVHKHLLMADTAMQRDINDDRVVLQFALEVRSPDILKMLFVLSCADLAAVGPGVLNNWKLELLTDLYRRTMRHVSAEDPPSRSTAEGIEVRRQQVSDAAPNSATNPAAAWWSRQIETLPPRYLFSAPRKKIVATLSRLQNLEQDQVVAWGEYLPDRKVVEYTIGAQREICRGIFHRLTGAFSSTGHEILWADICSLADGVLLDRFHVHDLDFTDEPPEERLSEVARRLEQSLRQPTDQPPSFRRLWTKESTIVGAHLQTKVGIDNETSEECSIIHIFAHDRRGLLYTITKAIYDLGLSVEVAKIGTYVDQVIDVFYVTEQATGGKIESEERIREVKLQISQAIEPVTVIS